MKICRVIAIIAALQGSVWFLVSAHAGPPPGLEVVKGTCRPSSHTAEGPLGADLTKRQSRFYCNSAVITFFDDYNGHVMIQFTEKESHNSPILGFAGKVENGGIIMDVNHIYFLRGKPTTASYGLCKFYFKNRHMSEIFCGAYVDETGRRTDAVVAFDAVPGQ
jgi:hypothetical protein